VMRAKFLKTRDSGGVGTYIDFRVDWPTLTFSPFDAKSEGDGTYSTAGLTNPSTTVQLKRTDKGKAKPKPKETDDSDDNEDVDAPSGIKTKSVIKNLGGKKKPFGQKKVKLA